MSKIRVYELAKELAVESKTLLAYLTEQGEFIRSAASVIEPLVVERIREDFPRAGAAEEPRRGFPPVRQMDQWLDDDQYSWPEEMTTVQAAYMCGLRTSTIRQWVRRGYLQPIGRKGRSSLFAVEAVREAQDRVLERTRKPVEPRGGVASKHLDRQVTTAIAARVVGVSPSTVRMWVHRGHLTPVSSSGRSHVFLVQDVLRAARRSAPRRGWRKR